MSTYNVVSKGVVVSTHDCLCSAFVTFSALAIGDREQITKGPDSRFVYSDEIVPTGTVAAVPKDNSSKEYVQKMVDRRIEAFARLWEPLKEPLENGRFAVYNCHFPKKLDHASDHWSYAAAITFANRLNENRLHQLQVLRSSYHQQGYEV